MKKKRTIFIVNKAADGFKAGKGIFMWIIFLGLFSTSFGQSDNRAIVLVMDGARWTETFGSGADNIPHMYNDMRPLGTVYTNFRIDYPSGYTETCPGHSCIETGAWQPIANDGSQRPTLPTIFEYLRMENGNPQSDCYAIAGKSKLDILTYSSYSGYGSAYGGTWYGDDSRDDSLTYSKAVYVMQTYSPKLMVVNFAEVDAVAHNTTEFSDYTNAITNVDNYIYQIWQHIQNGDYGYNTSNTTLFITNDHGRHTTNWNSHGDGCEGCTHIMLLVLGRNVTAGQVLDISVWQRDIAPTIGDLISFETPYATGTSFFDYIPQLPVELTGFTGTPVNGSILLEWKTVTEVNNFGFEIEKYNESSGWATIGFQQGFGNSNSEQVYNFCDVNPRAHNKYRLKQIDNDGQFEYSEALEVSGIIIGYTLSPNYPNPFNGSTNIEYFLPVSGSVVIQILNVLGEKVFEYKENKSDGMHRLEFDTAILPSGNYFYTISVNNFFAARKFTLLK